MASSSSSIDLSGPTFAVLTGASQGIGRALAVELSKLLGPNSVMLLLARNKDELAKTAELCKQDNVKTIYVSIDLSVSTAKEMYDVIVNALEGRKVTDFVTSTIFHNVGSLGNLGIATERMEDVDEMRQYYDLNVFNVIKLNTQFLKVFEEVEDRIVIVNITSLCAIKAMSGMASYCSGKAAREMYFKVLAEEKRNIRVLNYSPGPVETSMIDYVLAETVNTNLRDVFLSFKLQGTLLKPEVTAKKCLTVLQQGKFGPGDHVDYFDSEYNARMTGRKSLFLFLMGLAWKCRFSMPLLLSGTVAVLGRAWMFQIRVHTVHRLHENELAYYEEDEIPDEDDGTWETQSTDSWETIVEEVAYG